MSTYPFIFLKRHFEQNSTLRKISTNTKKTGAIFNKTNSKLIEEHRYQNQFIFAIFVGTLSKTGSE